MLTLFPDRTASDFALRAASPRLELGAYEALWDRKGASLRSIADLFRKHPGTLPSEFVPRSQSDAYARLAWSVLADAGLRCGVRLYGLGDYPERLRDALHPVQFIYFRGFWDLLTTPCVAIVGTRWPSAEGVRRAARLARRLVADGFTVVSGLARGIDTVAHETALQAGGRTIAVLGTPIATCYPPENRALQHTIGAEQLLISQVPIVRHARQDLRANKSFFAARTATMSALSVATVIVEAGEISGALVQARHALQQGRQLLILDSCFRDTALAWPRRLGQQGALRVADYEAVRRALAAAGSRSVLADRLHEHP